MVDKQGPCGKFAIVLLGRQIHKIIIIIINNNNNNNNNNNKEKISTTLSLAYFNK